MNFQDTPRVAYKLNPLKEVVIQYTFTGSLSSFVPNFSSRMVDLHQLLILQLPYFNSDTNTGVSFDLAGLQMGAPLATQNLSLVNYHFASESMRLTINERFLAFTVTEYESWEKFYGLVSTVFKFLAGEASVFSFRFARVGLRYRDIIERQVLGLGDCKWGELIVPDLLPGDLLSNPDLLGNHSTLVFRLNEGQLIANFAAVTNATSNEQAFMIDGDFFIEAESLDYAKADSTVQGFNKSARNFFRWCITDKLYDALQPSPKS